tara:strand:+ start:292 stop:1404 length:1113 start_codon:yes stop_codon:yes gene_type:complete
LRNNNVAIFSADMGRGGTQRVLATLSNYISKEREVDLLLLNKEGHYLREIDKNVNLIDLDSSRSIFSFFKLLKYFNRREPDLFIASMEHLHFISAIAILLSKSKVKAIYRLPSNPSYIYTEREHPTLYKKIQYKVLKISLKFIYNLNFVEAIIVPSEKVKEDFLLHFSLKHSNKLRVVANPIDTIQLDKVEPTKEVFFTNDYPIVLSMQRFEMEKDNFTVLRSIKETLKTRNVNFLLLGEGSQEKELKNLVQDLGLENNVLLPGFYADPFPILKKADVFVLSSFAEGMPNSLLQALYFNLPVIATDCNFGPSEILEDGKWGALVEIGDYSSMSEEIIKALDGKLQTMPKEIFKKKYSASLISKKYLTLDA